MVPQKNLARKGLGAFIVNDNHKILYRFSTQSQWWEKSLPDTHTISSLHRESMMCKGYLLLITTIKMDGYLIDVDSLVFAIWEVPYTDGSWQVKAIMK